MAQSGVLTLLCARALAAVLAMTATLVARFFVGALAGVSLQLRTSAVAMQFFGGGEPVTTTPPPPAIDADPNSVAMSDGFEHAAPRQLHGVGD